MRFSEIELSKNPINLHNNLKDLSNVKIVKNMFHKFKTPNIIYKSYSHNEQSKKDKIFSLIKNQKDNDILKEEIQKTLLLKNVVYKLSCFAFNWCVHKNDNINSFYIVFGYSTFINNTGYEKINKQNIHSTAVKRLNTKPFLYNVIVDYNTKITYSIVYNWLKKNAKYFKY